MFVFKHKTRAAKAQRQFTESVLSKTEQAMDMALRLCSKDPAIVSLANEINFMVKQVRGAK